MRRSRIAAAAVMAACAVTSVFSCVKSGATTCGDVAHGTTVCPSGLVCIADDIDTHCVDAALVAACKGRVDGMPCSVGAGGSGTCLMGICSIGYCGDGIVQFNEDCDGANLNNKTCLDFGATTAGGLACTSACTFDKSGCTAYCGDGKVEGIEQCDGTNLNGMSCTDYGFYSGTLSCTSACMANVAGCMGRCGDGVIQSPNEVCDGTNLNGQTCLGLGYKGTVVPLACGPNCAYSAESCTCGGALCTKNTQTCVTQGGISSCQ